ncbi:MAG: cobyrinate a,c-diamide synthase, partial [Thermodesulfobacteriota bacterium]
WILSKEYNRKLFKEKTQDSDIAVVEGVMGLFDGYDALSETGSTAQMAKWLDLPVVLIVSAGGKARSAAAVVKGFEEFDKDLKIAGVIFTKTGSLMHYEYLKNAVEQNCKTRCLGFMPQNDAIVMPERHLGLVTADELAIKPDVLSTLVSMVKEHIDMDALINNLDSFESLKKQPDNSDYEKLVNSDKSVVTIAVARDKAFCFYYQDNFNILKKFGAKIVEFSPLNDEKLPENIDGIYFGGGYPEIFVEKLSNNNRLLRQIKEKSISGMPVYGECGGFMFLCNQLSFIDDPRQYSMSNCFDLNIKMSKKLKSLGYREITLKQDTIIGKKGDVLRGHEFHYSSLESSDIDSSNVYKVTSRAGQKISLKGYQKFNTLASYLHIHFGSNEKCAEQFVKVCKEFKDRRIENGH